MRVEIFLVTIIDLVPSLSFLPSLVRILSDFLFTLSHWHSFLPIFKCFPFLLYIHAFLIKNNKDVSEGKENAHNNIIGMKLISFLCITSTLLTIALEKKKMWEVDTQKMYCLHICCYLNFQFQAVIRKWIEKYNEIAAR